MIMLMIKYEDMLDALDLNRVAKARQINSQLIITAHIKLQEFSNNFIFIIIHFCTAVYLKLYI